MPEETTVTTLEHETRRVFELLDALDLKGLRAMLTEDVQEVDEITRSWRRGRAGVEAYFAQLEGAVSDPRSQLSDLHTTAWGDVGLVTFVLDQTYKMNGREERLSAPTSMLFCRQDDGWKLALIHSVPLPDQPES